MSQPILKRRQPDGQVSEDAGMHLSTQVLEQGKERMVSFAGTSQFTAQGVSACGLAAFNFARIGFRIEQERRRHLPDILNDLGTRDVIEEIVAICAGWSSDMHLEVDDIHDLPIFSRALKPASTRYGSPGPQHFQSLLQYLKSMESSAVMIITRPPEIIACFKFANTNTNPDRPIFVVFDSHPRLSHPDGAGLSFSASIEHTARTLSTILPPIHFDAADFQWQAQLLANCSAHVYVARHRRRDHEAAVVQSSLDILDLRARIAGLRRDVRKLESDNRQLESEAGQLRTSIQQTQAASAQPQEHAVAARSYGVISHAVAGPSRTSGARLDARLVSPVKRACPTAGAQSIFAHNPPPVPSKAHPSYDDELWLEHDADEADDPRIESLHLANQLQDKYDAEDRQRHREHARLVRQLKHQADDHRGVARQIQDAFDAEDRRLREEQEALARFVQATFQCSICMDELPEDDVARVDECVHTMCRSCLREYVSSKIQEHRYPILCPMCTIEAKSQAGPGAISRSLIEQLGVSEEQFQTLTEMELAEFTIQIHCRRCRRAAFVDREDYTELPNIVCPQGDCNHVWCKKCEQTIVVGGPKHSCDGSSELDHLMKEKGWKHCPNCTTPILKETGCNHMTCISPGCNTHFCYVCGGMIVRSALNHEIGQAVSAHFRRCQLFEVPN